MSSLNEIVGGQVEQTAEWRRQKAVEFPNDDRNLRAAEELERLAAEIEKLDGSPTHLQLIEVQEQLYAAPGGDDVWIEINETLSAELRSVGFHGSWTAIEFLEWYRDLLLGQMTQELIKRAAPPPDLNEQVEDDPAVKAVAALMELGQQDRNDDRKLLRTVLNIGTEHWTQAKRGLEAVRIAFEKAALAQANTSGSTH